jgi:hypothetical protein
MKKVFTLLAGLSAALPAIGAQAQLQQQRPLPEASGEMNTMKIPVPPADQLPAPDMSNFRCHVFRVQPHGGAVPPPPDCDPLVKHPGPHLASTDLTFHGGPVITTTQHSFIFLNCSISCWGNPYAFLTDLFAGINVPFIHISDQYVRTTAEAYVTNPNGIQLSGTQPHTLLDSQLRALILTAIKSAYPSGGGGGYNKMYSIFLPQGQNLCLDSTHCYCPDNNCNGGPFTICAYHGSFDSTDAIGVPIHIIYQAQPYLNVATCQVTNGPNGSLVDSTNNVFSHEIFETITDPDGNAWFASTGDEIGDLCAWQIINPLLLYNVAYAVQKEYSNKSHQCVDNRNGADSGDTHITTFYGVHYDFQAVGDFVLVQAGPGFIVQARQERLSNPAVSLNTAVTAKMGKVRVSVCLNNRLAINGASTPLADGAPPLHLPGGVIVSRKGSVYSVASASGDMVTADESPGSYMNLAVRLGATSSDNNILGLLSGNPRTHDPVSSKGVPLPSPFNYEQFQSFGNSWKPGPIDWLLLDCGREINYRWPRQPIYAQNLPQKEWDAAADICQQKGVKGPPLDDCILDVSLLRNNNAADVFIDAPIPVRVLRPVGF